MTDIHTEVLVIGGGATGMAVVRDAAMRGFKTTLVERKDLAEGTTGRFHGLLHSGARYVVKDPRSARECMAENTVLRRIAPDCIEDCGGLFVVTPWDDPAYADRFVEGCKAAAIPVEEISVAEMLRREPRLNPQITRAFVVPDAGIDAWKTMWAHARSAREHGARVLTYHKVVEVLRSNGRVEGARVESATGERFAIHAAVTVNATGAWAGQLAMMAGIEGVDVLAGRGIMIAMNHRLVNTVVNRCEMPGDGDILVPIRTVCVIGTTDERAPDPDDLEIPTSEIDEMLESGEKLVPGFRQARALRAWAGARPLFTDAKQKVADTRDITRSHTLLDHRERDDVEGFLTITGGKFTTMRLMAEETVDGVCRHLNTKRECTTHVQPLEASEEAKFYWLGARVAERERTLHDDQLICECEMVQRSTIQSAVQRRPTFNIDDLRRALRVGMGPCQGGFCIYRLAGLLHELENMERTEANQSLLNFLQERWKGVNPILYGDQLRQARLDDWIFQGLLDLEHLPA